MQMKKTLLALPLVLVMYLAEAQSEREFQIRAGLGWAVYGTESEFTFKTPAGDFTSTETDGAATVHLPLELRYAFNEHVNAGLDFKFGSYLYDPDSSDGKSNRFVVAGIAGEYAFIAREKIRWYGGIGFNGSSLVLEETDELTDTKTVLTYSGGGFRLNTGLMVFLIGGFGLNFNLGYDAHNFKLRNYEVNGSEIDLDNIEATLRVAGVDGTIGAFLRF
jgi:hypothetical protein